MSAIERGPELSRETLAQINEPDIMVRLTNALEMLAERHAGQNPDPLFQVFGGTLAPNSEVTIQATRPPAKWTIYAVEMAAPNGIWVQSGWSAIPTGGQAIYLAATRVLTLPGMHSEAVTLRTLANGGAVTFVAVASTAVSFGL